VASTLNKRARFWSAWGRFLHFNFSGIDTNLSTLSQPERIDVLVVAFLQENEKFAPKQSKYRYMPPPQSLKWTDNLTRWLRHKENIIKKSANLLRDNAETTWHPSSN
jgi:hypothetical protein